MSFIGIPRKMSEMHSRKMQVFYGGSKSQVYVLIVYCLMAIERTETDLFLTIKSNNLIEGNVWIDVNIMCLLYIMYVILTY